MSTRDGKPVTATARHYRWSDMTAEPLKAGLSRRLDHERTHDDCACIPPRRVPTSRVMRTENEQITYISKAPCSSGWAPRTSRTLTVRAGEVLVIPSNLPHRALALEEYLGRRRFIACNSGAGRVQSAAQDWLNGSDAVISAAEEGRAFRDRTPGGRGRAGFQDPGGAGDSEPSAAP